MDINKKFNYIMENTEYGFHDGYIIQFKFIFERKIFKLSIEHCRFNESKNLDDVILSIFTFNKVNYLNMEKLSIEENDYFEDCISNFIMDKIDDDLYLFKITLDNGGEISLKCNYFEYKEEKKDFYQY